MLKSAFKAAFPKTIPILAGFLFLGFSYGVYMNVSGFSFVYPMVMSIVIFGGSLEFLTVSMLLPFCAASGVYCKPDDSGAAPVLRHFNA